MHNATINIVATMHSTNTLNTKQPINKCSRTQTKPISNSACNIPNADSNNNTHNSIMETIK